MSSTITSRIKSFILKEFLEGEDPEALLDSTPLITSGVLDSLATLKLIAFLEQEFNVQILPSEADADHLNTLAQITATVEKKLPAAKAG